MSKKKEQKGCTVYAASSRRSDTHSHYSECIRPARAREAVSQRLQAVTEGVQNDQRKRNEAVEPTTRRTDLGALHLLSNVAPDANTPSVLPPEVGEGGIGRSKMAAGIGQGKSDTAS